MELQNLPWYGQLAVFLLIGAALFGVFYFLVYSPAQDEINSVVARRETLDEEIRVAEKNESKLEKLKEEKVANEKILEELKGILPEKKEFAQHLRKIQAIASNARLKTSTFNFNQETARDYYFEWPIAISLEGNYHNLGIFFDQVSRMKKIFTVDRLQISPLNTSSYDYTIKADFVATTYIYREAPPQNPVAKRAAARERPVAGDEGLGGI
jgi:type IV pilus assembly protein PilO